MCLDMFGNPVIELLRARTAAPLRRRVDKPKR